MEYVSSNLASPQSSGVRDGSGRKTFEAVATCKAVSGGDSLTHSQAAFRRTDELLAQVGLTRKNVTAVHIFLHDVLRDVDGFNAAWTEYFEDHPACRYCVGATLQGGMLVEMNFFAEFPTDP